MRKLSDFVDKKEFRGVSKAFSLVYLFYQVMQNQKNEEDFNEETMISKGVNEKLSRLNSIFR